MENLIEVNPKIMVGKPVIKGPRITVELVLEKLAAGESIETILASYPHLTRDQILACIDYAHRSLRADRVGPERPRVGFNSSVSVVSNQGLRIRTRG